MKKCWILLLIALLLVTLLAGCEAKHGAEPPAVTASCGGTTVTPGRGTMSWHWKDSGVEVDALHPLDWNEELWVSHSLLLMESSQLDLQFEETPVQVTVKAWRSGATPADEPMWQEKNDLPGSSWSLWVEPDTVLELVVTWEGAENEVWGGTVYYGLRIASEE